MSKKVDVYGKEGCSNCVATRNWLDSNNIEHTYHHVPEDELDTIREEMHGYGVMAFPLIKIEGHKPFGGLSIKRLNSYLKQ